MAQCRNRHSRLNGRLAGHMKSVVSAQACLPIVHLLRAVAPRYLGVVDVAAAAARTVPCSLAEY